jgi:signal transduction histidine kinase
VQEIVDQAIQIARPQAEIYEVHLSLEPIPTLPKISGDKTQLVRALVNLLVNAINGSSSKGKEVVVSVRDRAGHLAIEVADNGIGIAEERLATLVKSDPFASEEGPSAGLGLFIANWVARNHHGELRLRRNEPTGTTASLLLPLMI